MNEHDPPQTQTEKPDYEWALDALLATVRELNLGSPEKALQVARAALWDPKRHPALPTSN